MKKKSFIIITVILLIVLGVSIFFNIKNCLNSEKRLPKPEVTEGERGALGIDKNINESTIDQYLDRDDSVYFDMRMLKDPGNYEAIGGDSYLSGFVEGFEVLSLPYLIPVSGLPKEVGKTYTGTTLFSVNKDGEYTPNYEESMDILEYFFPKDKNIFLMCGGGGYAGMAKNLLVSLGWDKDKIYDVGGYWYYDGDRAVSVVNKKGSKVTYDFWKVNYHDIDFKSLTKVK